MSALPPVFVEFLGITGQFKTAVREVERDIAKVEKTGGGTFAKFGKGASTGLGLVAGAAALATVKAIGMATSFQSEMTLLVTAAGEAQGNLKMLENGAMGISRQTGMATSQIAAGLYIVEKAGYRGANALQITKAAAEGATAEGVDMTTMTTALTSIMATYHMKASDAVSATNALVSAGGMSKTTMQEFAGSLSTVLPLAFAAHMSFAQVGAAIATMTQHGTSAQQATQDLANTIRNLQNPNQVAMKAMQQMGISVLDVTKHLGQRGLTGTLKVFTDAIAKHSKGGLVFVTAMKQMQSANQDLQTALGGMPANLRKLSQGFLDGTVSMKTYRTDIRNMGAAGYNQGAQFLALTAKAKGFNDLIKSGSPQIRTNAAALAQMMGGSTALNTALMLTGTSASGFTDRVKTLGAASGKTGKDISTWAVTSKTLKVQLGQMRQTVETLMISIGLKLIPVVQKIVAWLMKHKSIVEAVIVGIVALSAAFLALRVIMFATQVVTTILSVAINAMRIIYYGVRLAIIGVQLAMKSQWLATLRTTAAMVAQRVAVFALQAAVKVLEGVTWLLNAAMDANPITLIVIALVALAAAFYEGYKHSKTFRDIIDAVGRGLKTVWTDVLKPVVDFFKNHWKVALEIAIAVLMPFVVAPLLIIKYWKQILGFFEKLPGYLLDALKGAGKWLLRIGEDIIKGLWQGIKFVWNAEVKGWERIGSTIKGWFKDAKKWLEQIGKDILGGLWKGIKSIWDREIRGWENIGDTIKGWFKDAINWLEQIGEDVINGLWNGMKKIWKKATGWLSNLNPASWFNDINPYQGHAIKNLENVGQQVFQGLHNGMKSEWANVASWLSTIDPSSHLNTGGMNLGGIGGAGGLNGGAPVYQLNLTVQGSVLAEKDLQLLMEQSFQRIGARRGSIRTYPGFVRK